MPPAIWTVHDPRGTLIGAAVERTFATGDGVVSDGPDAAVDNAFGRHTTDPTARALREAFAQHATRYERSGYVVALADFPAQPPNLAPVLWQVRNPGATRPGDPTHHYFAVEPAARWYATLMHSCGYDDVQAERLPLLTPAEAAVLTAARAQLTRAQRFAADRATYGADHTATQMRYRAWTRACEATDAAMRAALGDDVAPADSDSTTAPSASSTPHAPPPPTVIGPHPLDTWDGATLAHLYDAVPSLIEHHHARSLWRNIAEIVNPTRSLPVVLSHLANQPRPTSTHTHHTCRPDRSTDACRACDLADMAEAIRENCYIEWVRQRIRDAVTP